MHCLKDTKKFSNTGLENCWEAKGTFLLKPPSPIPHSSKSSWNRLSRTISSWVLTTSMDGDSTASPSSVCNVWPQTKKVFSCVQMECHVFQFVLIAYCPTNVGALCGGSLWDSPVNLNIKNCNVQTPSDDPSWNIIHSSSMTLKSKILLF